MDADHASSGDGFHGSGENFPFQGAEAEIGLWPVQDSGDDKVLFAMSVHKFTM